MKSVLHCCAAPTAFTFCTSANFHQLYPASTRTTGKMQNYIFMSKTIECALKSHDTATGPICIDWSMCIHIHTYILYSTFIMLYHSHTFINIPKNLYQRMTTYSLCHSLTVFVSVPMNSEQCFQQSQKHKSTVLCLVSKFPSMSCRM